jgi:hypothetical protein
MMVALRQRVRLVAAAICAGAMSVTVSGAAPVVQAGSERADVALVLAVDVSNSVTPERYRLQMDGIADAFADPDVQQAILSGPNKAMFVVLVQWSDRPTITIPWTLITDEESALQFGERVRADKRQWEGFTCMADALQYIYDRVLPLLPAPAERQIVNVSGDGRNNCGMLMPALPADKTPMVESTALIRDMLVAEGVTINGLPILEGDEAETLEAWFHQNVIGGLGSFLISAHGFADVRRAMRLKFVTELISSR